ncbi:MAG: FHA domain-containing protein [Bdellovibrionaceae bacterium]|nr:FHA domain-containing protein [Pseudobdellovibrionaceae bacterium]MBX3032728.1 FHA domain-containing protein [Pseudobdellovibrionaceae bacterium]
MSAAPSIADNLRFTLEVLKGPHAGMKLEFDKGTISIGRGVENDVVLANDPRVSRQHAEIKQSLGQFYLVNLSQKNFVLLNGQNIATEKMESKAVLQIGESEIRFTVQGSTNLLEPISPAAVVVPLKAEAPAARPSAAPGPRPQQAPAFPPPPVSPGMPAGFNASSMPRPPSGPSSGGGLFANRKFVMYAVIALMVVLFVLANAGKKTKKVEDRPFRTEEELGVARQEAENEIKAFQERKERMNQQIYQKAYENFLRGYRDYRQGQYLRARESFQVVLNLDPENELARRYMNLSKIRFDELVKFNMLQGRRYLEKQNYRMCKARYQTVMTMLGYDPSSPEYKEALMMHKQCSVALEGRY